MFDSSTAPAPAPLKHTHPGQLGKITNALKVKIERWDITEVSKNWSPLSLSIILSAVIKELQIVSLPNSLCLQSVLIAHCNISKGMIFLESKGKYFVILFKGKCKRYQGEKLLELKGFILLKVFSSNVQSAFPLDISYMYFRLNKNHKVFFFNLPLTFIHLQCSIQLQ